MPERLHGTGLPHRLRPMEHPSVYHKAWFTLSTVLVPVVLVSLLVLSVVWKFKFKKFKFKPKGGRSAHLRHPPSPFTKFPLLGSLPQLLYTDKEPHRYTEELLVQHGPVIQIRAGRRKHVVVGSSGLAKECLESQDLYLASRPKKAAAKYLSFENDDLAIAPYGDHWVFLRSLYCEELLSSEQVAAFAKIRFEEMSLFVRSIMKQQKGQKSIYVNLSKRLAEISLNMITMMVMSKRSFPYEDIHVTHKAFGRVYSEKEIGEMRSRGPDWRRYTSEMLKLFTSPLLEDIIPIFGFVDKLSGKRDQMKRAKERLVELYQDMLKEHHEKRRRNPSSEAESNLLDLLLMMPGPRGEDNLSLDTIMGLVQATVAVGSLSTSATIEWAMAHLFKNPKCMVKCVQELDLVVGTERRVEQTDLASLPYLRAVVKETFRLTPTMPLLLPHATTNHVTIGEFDIAPKTVVSFHVWAIGRNPLIWPNPLVFDPDRFLNSDIDVRGQHFQLFPFGAGRRSCPAMDMSLHTVQLTLATLLQSFTWSLPKDMAPDELDMREVYGTIITRRRPLDVNAMPRLSPKLF